MLEPSCTLYARHEAIYIFPDRDAGGWRTHGGPVLKVAPNAPEQELGTAVLDAIEVSTQTPEAGDVAGVEDLVVALGFPTLGRFERGAKYLGIAVGTGERVTITPCAAWHGGFVSLRESVTCARAPECVGQALLSAIDLATDDGKDQVPPVEQQPGKEPGGTQSKDDYPVSFGYKNSWLAIRTDDTYAVVFALGLKDARAVNWRNGVNQAYRSDDGVFVTPVVNGWSLAVGHGLPYAYSPEWLPYLREISRVLGHVQFFATHRGVNYQAWAKADHGAIVRAYVNGEGGWIDVGVKTIEEEDLGFNFLGEDATEEELEAYWERDEPDSPDEEHVVSLAGRWSLDPTELDREESSGLGVIGVLRSDV